MAEQTTVHFLSGWLGELGLTQYVDIFVVRGITRQILTEWGGKGMESVVNTELTKINEELPNGLLCNEYGHGALFRSALKKLAKQSAATKATPGLDLQAMVVLTVGGVDDADDCFGSLKVGEEGKIIDMAGSGSRTKYKIESPDKSTWWYKRTSIQPVKKVIQASAVGELLRKQKAGAAADLLGSRRRQTLESLDVESRRRFTQSRSKLAATTVQEAEDDDDDEEDMDDLSFLISDQAALLIQNMFRRFKARKELEARRIAKQNEQNALRQASEIELAGVEEKRAEVEKAWHEQELEAEKFKAESAQIDDQKAKVDAEVDGLLDELDGTDHSEAMPMEDEDEEYGDEDEEYGDADELIEEFEEMVESEDGYIEAQTLRTRGWPRTGLTLPQVATQLAQLMSIVSDIKSRRDSRMAEITQFGFGIAKQYPMMAEAIEGGMMSLKERWDSLEEQLDYEKTQLDRIKTDRLFLVASPDGKSPFERTIDEIREEEEEMLELPTSSSSTMCSGNDLNSSNGTTTETKIKRDIDVQNQSGTVIILNTNLTEEVLVKMINMFKASGEKVSKVAEFAPAWSDMKLNSLKVPELQQYTMDDKVAEFGGSADICILNAVNQRSALDNIASCTNTPATVNLTKGITEVSNV